MSGSGTVRSIERDYRRRTRRSAELFEAGTSWIAGGASRSLVAHRPHPLVMVEGKGSRFTDADGNTYLDFVNCHTALVHGNAHPAITAAIREQAARGTASSFAGQEEASLARLLCERVRSVEQLRFCCSGTEAGMYVARIARAHTGRDRLLKFEGGYHGSYDDLEISKSFPVSEAGPPDRPVPVSATQGFARGTTERVVVVRFNDREAFVRAISESRHELAAVIIEPMLGAAGMIPPEDGFLSFVREVTRDQGILLVADEVVTFRLAHGGAQGLYDFRPDLTMFGKLIGGGLPVAAIGGRSDLMALSSYDLSGTTVSRLSLSGTFSGAALGMAAGRASLRALTVDAISHINSLGDRMRQALRKSLADAGIAGQVTGAGSLLKVHYTDEPVRDYRSAMTSNRIIQSAMHLWLLNHGIATYPRGAICLSTPMTTAEIDSAVQTFAEGLRELKPCVLESAPHLIVA